MIFKVFFMQKINHTGNESIRSGLAGDGAAGHRPGERLRMLVIDPVDNRLVAALREGGMHVTEAPGLKKEELIASIGQYHILLRRTRLPIGKDVIDAAQNLGIIGSATVGIDNIDIEYAKSRGIVVVNAPRAATQSVVELTFGLTFEALRKIHRLAAELEEGVFHKESGSELAGKTVGIIGLGRIGTAFARALAPFGVEVLATDTVDLREKAREVGAEFVGLDELLARSDIISLHVNGVNTPLIDGPAFCKMKPGTMIINTCRAGAIDRAALLGQLANGGKVGFYAADVLWDEGLADPVQRELIRSPKVLMTPHVGSSTEAAQARVGKEIGEALMGAIRTQFPGSLYEGSPGLSATGVSKA
jgi:D-3-phosphoglycerate dehydrogenase